MTPFTSLPEYENFIYTILDQFTFVQRSTLILIQRHKYRAELVGELFFSQAFRLSIYEHMTWEQGSLLIEGYSYEAWQGNEKLYWYDSQPHPNDPSLASTHPHHKHIPPNIKRNRVPAPHLSFTAPNLPFLIDEMAGLLAR